MRRKLPPGFIAAALFILVATWVGAAAAAEVTVYSERRHYWSGPAFEAFTRQTGITVEIVKGDPPQMLERLKAEGDRTQADVFMTNDAGNLWEAARAGLLAPIESSILAASVPAHLRDPEHRWFTLAVRPRTILYSTQRVKPSELSTYEALGDPKWKNRLCFRSSSASPYNTSMLAAWIKRYGEPRVERIVKSWVANNPVYVDNDTDVLKAISAGQCDVGITLTYYLGRLIVTDPSFPVAPFWPDQEGAGVSVNVAGAGVTARAKNRANAIRLLEFLSSAEAQNSFVDANLEYPVNPTVKPHPILQQWGPFKADDTAVTAAGEFRAAAIELASRAGYK